jgi:hypothetical protein
MNFGGLHPPPHYDETTHPLALRLLGQHGSPWPIQIGRNRLVPHAIHLLPGERRVASDGLIPTPSVCCGSTDLRARCETDRVLAEAMGVRGVQAFVLRSAVAQLGRLVNHFLARLSDGGLMLALTLEGERISKAVGSFARW